MDRTDKLLQRLDELHEIGVALSREKDIHRLLERILGAARRITGADGGTLYRVSEDGEQLEFAVLRNTSLGLSLGGVGEARPQLPPLPLKRADGQPNSGFVAVHAALTQETVNIGDTYAETGFDFSGARQFDDKHAYRSQSLLAVPMVSHEGEVLGVLQLVNAIDELSGAVIPFSPASQRLAESLASQAAIALSNRQLILQQEKLFESFVRMINSAVDAKSPYTGAHCQRVPVLTMMLAEAVAATTDGPFADFSMTEEDRRELHIAALLHDCGKITTPVHVIDKSTKLETIFDRIELVATRFEVARRDAEIEMLMKRLALRDCREPEEEERLRQQYAQRAKELTRDCAFLRVANLGGEAMSEADQERVKSVGRGTWWTDAAGEMRPLLTQEEIENLCVRSGTLTAQERQIINRHIDITIEMLERLPWIGGLKRVPEFAGGHHERMDGSGYPRGLTREQMPVQARIMGIADIFEALTAADRPYKEGKRLSEALAIMARMSQTGHIDAELFEVFVESGVWEEYGQRYLSREQRDEVAVAALLQM